MTATKENHNERLLGVQMLLSDCAKRVDALCRLYESCLQEAKQNFSHLLAIYNRAHDNHDEIKRISTDKSAKGSKLVVKSLVSNVKKDMTDFTDIYDKSKNILNDNEKLRKEYKGDVNDCCKAHAQMRERYGIEPSKGYKNLVNMIKKILNRIDEVRHEFKEDLKVKLDELYNRMMTIYNGANLLATTV